MATMLQCILPHTPTPTCIRCPAHSCLLAGSNYLRSVHKFKSLRAEGEGGATRRMLRVGTQTPDCDWERGEISMLGYELRECDVRCGVGNTRRRLSKLYFIPGPDLQPLWTVNLARESLLKSATWMECSLATSVHRL